MRTLSLIFGSILTVGLSAQARELVPGREGVATCVIQAIYSNNDLIEFRPTAGKGEIGLKPQGPKHWAGTATHELAPLRPGAQSYKVELRLSVEKDRSTWVEETPRLTVLTRLTDGKGRLLALNESNSDQLLTPTMLGWMRDREGARVISKMLNPDLQNRLENVADEEIKRLAAQDGDRALKLALARGLLPQTDMYRIDTVCLLPL